MFGLRAALQEGIADLKERIAELKVERKHSSRAVELSDEVVNLKVQISTLEIDKAKLKEAHEREDRELRHMIGLEKKRQEFEVASAKRETELKVREENLAADKARFAEQMKFQTDRFEKEVGYLKEMVGQVLERLPVVTVNKAVK